MQRSIVKSLEIIGEAVKQLEGDFKKRNIDIDWKKIAGFRDILIHRYFSVDWDIIWDVIKHKIPELKEKLNNLKLKNTQENENYHQVEK